MRKGLYQVYFGHIRKSFMKKQLTIAVTIVLEKQVEEKKSLRINLKRGVNGMNKEILKKAIKRYGTHNQMLKCIEECGELSRAVSRILTELSSGDGFTTEASQENLYEELADVLIMIEQMIIMFDCGDEVFIQQVNKMKRLKERLEQ